MANDDAGASRRTHGMTEFIARLPYEKIRAAVFARNNLLVLDSLGCAICGARLLASA